MFISNYWQIVAVANMVLKNTQQNKEKQITELFSNKNIPIIEQFIMSAFMGDCNFLASFVKICLKNLSVLKNLYRKWAASIRPCWRSSFWKNLCVTLWSELETWSSKLTGSSSAAAAHTSGELLETDPWEMLFINSANGIWVHLSLPAPSLVSLT